MLAMGCEEWKLPTPTPTLTLQDGAELAAVAFEEWAENPSHANTERLSWLLVWTYGEEALREAHAEAGGRIDGASPHRPPARKAPVYWMDAAGIYRECESWTAQGCAGRVSKNIWLRDGQGDSETLFALIHEYSHVMGVRNECLADMFAVMVYRQSKFDLYPPRNAYYNC